jgi:ATP-binding cassette subfamily B protein
MNYRHIKRFLPYFLKYKALLILTLFSMLISSVSSSLLPFYAKKIIDQFIATKEIKSVVFSSLIMLLLAALTYALKLIQIYYGNLAGQRIMKDIRLDFFKKLTRFEIETFNREPSGKIITRITNDIENMNELLNSGIISLLSDLLLVFFAVFFLLYINPKLALISISPLPLAIFLSFIFGNKMEKAYEKVRDALTKINIHMQESLTGLSVVQIFQNEKRNFQKFDSHAKDFRFSFHRSIMLNVLLRQSINVMSYVSTFLLYLFGGILAISGKSTIGTIVAFGYYLSYLYGPLGDLSDKFSILQNAISSMKKIDEFLTENREEENIEKGKAIELKGNISLNNVCFSYEKNNNVLENINLKTEKGQKIAIVGYTGAGKSTLANLILAFYKPTSGEIYFEGENLLSLSKQQLRKNMAIVLQNIFIFKGTVSDNITLGKEFSDEEVIAAAKKIGVHDFIMRLPQGYDTELLTEGKNISLGERQLISFARALVFNPRILILDEATASIDSQTEALIEKGIKELLKGRTSIVIAHRLSTIRNANTIVVLNKGRIVETGTHEELMQTKGLYYEFYTTQFSEL